jgi:hypothetical protein
MVSIEGQREIREESKDQRDGKKDTSIIDVQQSDVGCHTWTNLSISACPAGHSTRSQ